MVAIGGDHSISYPLGRGMEPLGEFDVVHVDAHADFLDELDGARLTGRASCGAWQSCRSSAPSPRLESAMWIARRWTGCGSWAGAGRPRLDVIERGAGDVVRDTVPDAGRCTSRSTSTFSTPRSRPGTRCPSPAGSATAAAGVLVELARRGRVIGFDVVELNPARDPSGATSRVATWIVTHFLSEIFDMPR